MRKQMESPARSRSSAPGAGGRAGASRLSDEILQSNSDNEVPETQGGTLDPYLERVSFILLVLLLSLSLVLLLSLFMITITGVARPRPTAPCK